MRGFALGLVAAFVMLTAGCDDCECLRDVCALCPDDAEGRVARESCEKAADSQDEAACSERLDADTYADFGCR